MSLRGNGKFIATANRYLFGCGMVPTNLCAPPSQSEALRFVNSCRPSTERKAWPLIHGPSLAAPRAGLRLGPRPSTGCHGCPYHQKATGKRRNDVARHRSRVEQAGHPDPERKRTVAAGAGPAGVGADLMRRADAPRPEVSPNSSGRSSSNADSTQRPSTVPKSNDSALHSVGIGALLESA
jgi:hypothetical protein